MADSTRADAATAWRPVASMPGTCVVIRLRRGAPCVGVVIPSPAEDPPRSGLQPCGDFMVVAGVGAHE